MDDSQKPDDKPVEDTTSTGQYGTETPTESSANFVEDFASTKDLDKPIMLGDALAMFREVFSTVSGTLDKADNLLKKIDKQEEAIFKKANDQGRTLGDDEGNAWYRTVMNALTHANINQAGEEASTREGSEWRQVLEYEGQSLRPGQPKQRLGDGHHTVEEKLTYMSRRAGVGTVFDVPLYHSGIWVRMKTPPLSALTSLQYQLSQLKVTLGSDSKGMAFSNTGQVLTSVAVDFALQYVIDTNIHTSTPSDLKERIRVLDIPTLLWGLAVTLYPNGFPYVHPCVADPENCQHVVKETLNLNRLFWTDSVSLTKTQKKLMARRFQHKLTEEEYTLYHAEKVRGNNRVVWFEDLGVTLKVPTVQEYEDAGRDWINGIIEMTQGAFNEPPHGANRDRYILSLGEATTARQYSHWVADIRERDDDGEDVIADSDDVINEALNHVFSTEEYAESFLGKITEFVDDAMLSMVAIPSFDCPSCKKTISEGKHERFPHLVPLDVLTTFFTLVNRKLN